MYRDNQQAIDHLNCFIREQVQVNRKKLEETSGLDRMVLIQDMLSGMREHQKYFIIQNLCWIKQSITQEVDTLVVARVLKSTDDIFCFRSLRLKK